MKMKCRTRTHPKLNNSDCSGCCVDKINELETLRSSSLSEASLARRWEISVRTLQNWRLRGVGVPFHHVGRCVRYRLIDIAEFEVAHRALSTSDQHGEAK